MSKITAPNALAANGRSESVIIGWVTVPSRNKLIQAGVEFDDVAANDRNPRETVCTVAFPQTSELIKLLNLFTAVAGIIAISI